MGVFLGIALQVSRALRVGPLAELTSPNSTGHVAQLGVTWRVR